MTDANLRPPVAEVVPHTFVQHGRALVDNYAWLQDKSDPRVLAYVEAENAYARVALAHTEELQERLFAELRGRVKEDDSTVPQRRGEYLYYSRVQAGRQYRVFCRRRPAPDAPEEVLLDENALAEGLDFCKVFYCEPSPDHHLLAYAVDTTGSWVYDLYVKDLRSGELVAGPIANTAWSAAWASDSRTLFYTLFDDAHRPFKLMRHAIGDEPAADALVHHEPDETFSIYVGRTRSGAYILATIASHTTSEVRYLPADEPTASLATIEPRRHWLEYYAEHHGDCFLIRTNDAAENFKLVEAPVSAPSREHWREIIPHRADTLVEGVDAFRDHLVVYERQGGLQRVRLSDPDGVSNARYVPFPEPVYTFEADLHWGRPTPSSTPRCCGLPTARWSRPTRPSTTTWSPGPGR